MKNRRFESNLSKITRPVAAIKSLRFALFNFIMENVAKLRFICLTLWAIRYALITICICFIMWYIYKDIPPSSDFLILYCPWSFMKDLVIIPNVCYTILSVRYLLSSPIIICRSMPLCKGSLLKRQLINQPVKCGDRIIPVQPSHYHGCWCLGSLKRQDISTHDGDYVK